MIRRAVLLAVAAGGLACGTLLGAADDDGPSTVDGGDARDDVADAGGGMDAATDADSEAGRVYKLVFVSSEVSPGDMQGFLQYDAGIDRADKECLYEGYIVGRLEGYRAWLSVSSFSAIERLTPGVGWTLPSGKIVFDDTSDIADGKPPKTPIVENASGADIIAAGNVAFVWTGTGANGKAIGDAGERCDDWSSGTTPASGTVGNAAANDGTWTNRGTPVPCEQAMHVYCFQK